MLRLVLVSFLCSLLLAQQSSQTQPPAQQSSTAGATPSTAAPGRYEIRHNRLPLHRRKLERPCARTVLAESLGSPSQMHLGGTFSFIRRERPRAARRT